MPSTAEIERFWAKADKTAGAEACWPWPGPFSPKGYGEARFDKQNVRAHRAAALLSGQNIAGKVVRHSCDNRRCVNPAHLTAGTTAENNRDLWERGRQGGSPAINAARTHCIHGHSLSGENLRVRRNGTRACKACQLVRSLKHQRSKAARRKVQEQ